jgi:hypothetical protein
MPRRHSSGDHHVDPLDLSAVFDTLQTLSDEIAPGHRGGYLNIDTGHGKIKLPIAPYRPPVRRKYTTDDEEDCGLGQRELDILQAVAEHFEEDDAEPMKADDIAGKAGYDNTGQFRQALADLCKMGRLKRNPRGPGYMPA